MVLIILQYLSEIKTKFILRIKLLCVPDVSPNTLTANMKAFFFFLTQRQLHHLFHAFLTDNSRNSCKNSTLSVLSVQFEAHRKDSILIKENRMHRPGSGHSDSVFCAEFPVVNFPAPLYRCMLRLLQVESKTGICLSPIRQRSAMKADTGPWGKLIVSVFSQHISLHGPLEVPAGLPVPW